jgi:hypothetical protein
MTPQDPGMREIIQWWDEFSRRADTRPGLLETAIGKELRRRIFAVHSSDRMIDLFDKLDIVLEFYFSLAKKVRSAEMWRLMFFWSLRSIILWADYAEAENQSEELDDISTGDLPEPAATYH